MTFEDFVKSLQEHRKLPEGVDVPQGSLQVGPVDEVTGETAVLSASSMAVDFDDAEIQELEQKTT